MYPEIYALVFVLPQRYNQRVLVIFFFSFNMTFSSFNPVNVYCGKVEVRKEERFSQPASQSTIASEVTKNVFSLSFILFLSLFFLQNTHIYTYALCVFVSHLAWTSFNLFIRWHFAIKRTHARIHTHTDV